MLTHLTTRGAHLHRHVRRHAKSGGISLVLTKPVWGPLLLAVLALAAPPAPSAADPAPALEHGGSVVSSIAAPPPSASSALGVDGTTPADLVAFAEGFNAQREMHGLPTISLSRFRYDACMETRLFWIAEDPSKSVASAWGHVGSTRSDGAPSVGCDGNLAGGLNDTGATVAAKWWDSLPHRLSLYKPSYAGSLESVCIFFAMTHGGVPNEPEAFARASAKWGTC